MNLGRRKRAEAAQQMGLESGHSWVPDWRLGLAGQFGKRWVFGNLESLKIVRGREGVKVATSLFLGLKRGNLSVKWVIN